MEYIALEVFDLDGDGSQFAFLPDDTSITITDTSEIFDSGDVWSHSFVLNVFANAHIFGTTGDIHGGRIHEQIDKRKARLWVMGLPMYYGYLKLDDEVEIAENGNVDVAFESGRKTFLQMVDGVKANQVPIDDDILIGMALKRERTLNRDNVGFVIKGKLAEFWSDGHSSIGPFTEPIGGDTNLAQEFPKYVRPKGVFTNTTTGIQESIGVSTPLINKQFPYDMGHPFCNTRICYPKYGKYKNGDTWEKRRERSYKICEPERINPAPNFYVLYWFDRLMKHLSIIVEENQMLNVEDLRRLFFVNSKCAYKTKNNGYYTSMDMLPVQFIVPQTSADDPSWELQYWWEDNIPMIDGAPAQYSLDIESVGYHHDQTPLWQKAYATSDNFPNVDIKDVIEGIEAGFGVRLMFDRDFKKVRAVLLRDVFRSQDVHDLAGTTISESKTENNIRGFRLTYGGSDEDTAYNYKGFVQAKIDQAGGWVREEDLHDYSQFNLDMSYEQVKTQVNMLNKTCYVVQSTNNAYIIKIDQDAKDAADKYYPSLFECAEFMDAEDGDCTGEEETTKEIRVGFTPAISNAMDDGGYAIFIGEEMGVPFLRAESGNGYEPNMAAYYWPERGRYFLVNEDFDDQTTTVTGNDMDIFTVATRTWFTVSPPDGFIKFTHMPDGTVYKLHVQGWIKEGYAMALRDNFAVNDELESPLEKFDWGLTLGIMRGSGSDSYIDYKTDENDPDNQYWEAIQGSGSYTHIDTCDDYGTLWDYNGSVKINTPEMARQYMPVYFPDSNVDLIYQSPGVLRTRALYFRAARLSIGHALYWVGYSTEWGWEADSSFNERSFKTEMSRHAQSIQELMDWDSANLCRIAGVYPAGGAPEQKRNLLNSLQMLAVMGKQPEPPIFDENGVGSLEGRISLKLRAEKPNPYFDPSQPESSSNRRYIKTTNPDLQNRGLSDQFYKEYSYWIRNARIVTKQRDMEIADILSIDKTVRQRVDDVVGFVKKLQYTVGIKTGLSPVDLELWYI